MNNFDGTFYRCGNGIWVRYVCAHKVGQRAHQYVHELSTPGEKKESV